MISVITAWFTGPVWAFLKRVPYWVWLVLLFVVTGRIMLSKDRVAQQKKGAAKAQEKFDEAIEEANQEVATRTERAIEAGDEIDEVLFGDPDNSADSLNAIELCKLTEKDPQNRGRVVRRS